MNVVASGWSTAVNGLHQAQNQALDAAVAVSGGNPDDLLGAAVSLQQAKLQTQLNATVIRSLDDTTGYLLDILA
ncbi:MAG: hypothetical protein KF824_06480 [Fimbriimonadaceae bacterium]|nr:MAG: hypothetical protein KF824_06480 [Fimbriimonadaceae bacterium]